MRFHEFVRACLERCQRLGARAELHHRFLPRRMVRQKKFFAAALYAFARLRTAELSDETARISLATARSQSVDLAQATDKRGRRCLYSPTDVGMARTHQGGYCASLVQIDGGGTAHVTSEPRAVATGLVKHFHEWMGGNATWWHSDTSLGDQGGAGRRLRRAILDGTLTDLEATGIPLMFSIQLRPRSGPRGLCTPRKVQPLGLVARRST